MVKPRSRTKVALSRSRGDYLKALYVLAESEPDVAPSRLAARLAVSAPSVTNMLRRLADEGLVARSRGAGARLTAAGRHEALILVRRHRILEAFLVRVLGLDWSDVHEDAEVLEHHVSDRVLDALDRLMAHPSEDPHGHPIPDRRGRLARRALRPLASLPRGARATVREIRDRDRRRMAAWKQSGLVPGARVRMCDVRALDDVYEVDVEGRRLVTGSEGLDGVLVERRREGAHER
jgi:DtxR family transcriptional regulator, Mn-dependent transcriptional regulator